MKKIGIAGVLILLSAITATNVLAHRHEHESEAAALAQTKISLQQAVDTATAAVPGQVLSAELDERRDQTAYFVEVVDQGRIYEVTIDSQSGKVIDKKLDREDDDDHGHDEDRD